MAILRLQELLRQICDMGRYSTTRQEDCHLIAECVAIVM